jgi:hypothetical protein
LGEGFEVGNNQKMFLEIKGTALWTLNDASLLFFWPLAFWVKII